MSSELTVLVVDDDPAIRTMLDLALREAGFQVVLSDGRAVDDTRDADVALLDVRLGNRTARELLDDSPALRSVPIILMTATTGVDTAGRLFPEARAALKKPFDLDDLERTIRAVAGDPAPDAG
ncbi:MAG: response regulator [Chloroflexota bacterium]